MSAPLEMNVLNIVMFWITESCMSPHSENFGIHMHTQLYLQMMESQII